MCLVTGAARGLGNEFCRAFVESGCSRLAIVDLKEEEAKRAAEELTAEFGAFASHSHAMPSYAHSYLSIPTKQSGELGAASSDLLDNIR